MKKPKTLQNRLFKNYSIVMSLILVFCFAILSFFYIHNEYRRTTEYLNTLTASIANSIDQETDKLSNASMNTVYSKQLRNDVNNIDGKDPDWNLIFNVNKIIASIIGPYSTVSQINVYSIKDYMVGWGTFSISRPALLTEQSWFPEVNDLHGAKYIGIPSPSSDFIKINPYIKNRYYISMIRMYYDSAYKPLGAIQVLQDCKTFFSYVKDLQDNNPNLSIQIINSDGAAIFPYDTDVIPPASQAFMACTVSEQTGWEIIVTQNMNSVLQKLFPFLLLFTGFLILFLCASLYLCFYMAKSLVVPLNSLKLQLEKVNLNEILTSDTSFLLDCSDNTTTEIDTLMKIYNSMYLSLKETSQSIITAKAEETKAKLFATQSMLKPHFLYNSLTNIEVMAENNMTPQIISFCNNLCSYLRYISSDVLSNVDISTEIKYSVNYLDCMKIRYSDKLHYSIDIPKELQQIQIPKLTLQPIIENSIKYAFHNTPPWMIKITAVKEGDYCYLSVVDNGIGFTQESLLDLHNQFEEIKCSKDIYSIEIGGLGLKNVFLRLLFMYGEESDLLLYGNQNAGAKIVLKIPLTEKE